jgi:ketosteroid isomerase-like protein
MKREFRDILDNYSHFVRNKDYEGFIGQYAPNLINYDLWQAATYNTISSWQKNINKWFDDLGDEYVTVTFRDITVYESRNTAFLHGIMTYEGHSKEGDVLRAMDNRLSWGLIYLEREWKIVHEHTSLPIDAMTMHPVFNIPQ